MSNELSILEEICIEEQLSEEIHNLQNNLSDTTCSFLESMSILEEALLLEGVGPVAMPAGDFGRGGVAEPPKGDHKPKTDPKPEEDGNRKAALDKIELMLQKAMGSDNPTINIIGSPSFGGDYNRKNYDSDNSMSYAPTPAFAQVTRIGDMKFPENIIFFIKQLITWIKNNILNFIDKFSNIVRSLLGLETAKKSRFSPDDLKLKLAKARSIETEYLVSAKDAYKPTTGFDSDILNLNKMMKNYKPAELIYADPNDIKMFEELNILKSEEPEIDALMEADDSKKSSIVLRLDTSKDLLALRESLIHFFDLFDNAFGSNDEKLFSIEDLEVMLQLFTKILDSSKKHKFGGAFEYGENLFYNNDAISATRLKDNLLRTKINCDNLKKAYTITNQNINTIATIIMNKNLMGAKNMGVSYAFLSASTYEIVIELVDMLDERLKEAKEMNKKLQKMKTTYESLVRELEKRRAAISAVTGISYTTALSRRIEELYLGAKYMTQTIQLRLSTLAMFISELNDTKIILKNLTAVPEAYFRNNIKGLKVTVNKPLELGFKPGV